MSREEEIMYAALLEWATRADSPSLDAYHILETAYGLCEACEGIGSELSLATQNVSSCTACNGSGIESPLPSGFTIIAGTIAQTLPKIPKGMKGR